MNADPKIPTAAEFAAVRAERDARFKPSTNDFSWAEKRDLQRAIDTLAKALKDDEDAHHDFLVHSNHAMNAIGRKSFLKQVGDKLRARLNDPTTPDDVSVVVDRQFYESKSGNAEWIKKTVESHGYDWRIVINGGEVVVTVVIAPAPKVTAPPVASSTPASSNDSDVRAALEARGKQIHDELTMDGSLITWGGGWRTEKKAELDAVNAELKKFIVAHGNESRKPVSTVTAPPVAPKVTAPPAAPPVEFEEPEPKRTVRKTLLARKARLENEYHHQGGGFMPCVMVGDGMGGQVDFRDKWKSDKRGEIDRVNTELARLDSDA